VLYGCEKWNIRATDMRRKTAGYAWTDFKTNTETEKELNIAKGVDKIQEFIRNWLQHINRVPCKR